MLLGHVRKVEEMCERPGDRHGSLERHARQFGAQRVEVSSLVGAARIAPAGLGERPHGLDSIEECLSFLAPQRLAQQLTEKAHVVANRLVRIGN